MFRRRLTTAVVMLTAGFSMIAGAVSANAETPDEAFTKAVSALAIPFAADTDVPAVGHQVCDLLKTGLTDSPNPVPVVRGVVTTLQGRGLSREQAGGLVKVSTYVYCQQYARYVGR